MVNPITGLWRRLRKREVTMKCIKIRCEGRDSTKKVNKTTDGRYTEYLVCDLCYQDAKDNSDASIKALFDQKRETKRNKK